MYDKVCKNCGTYLSDFYRTGMLGCPKCYDAFGKEISDAIKEIQAGDLHVGKVPPFSSEEKELLYRYERLFKEKETAVMEGRFSDVKAISEELIRLKEKLTEMGLL